MDSADLVPIIREWVRIDSEMRDLQKKQTALRNEKRTVTAALISAMKTGGIDRVALASGHISYTQTTVRKPITQKSLLSILTAYCENDATRAENILSFILDNRGADTRETIMRRITATEK